MAEEIDRMLHESPEYRQEQLSAALDGMLSPEEQEALDAHLAGCDACTRELEEMRQVRALLRAVPQPALPRTFLLPIEDAPVVANTPAHAAEREPARNVTPLRQPSRATARVLRVTRWIGTIAAVLGLALFLGTLLPTLSHQGSAASTNAPAQGQDRAHNPAMTSGTASGIHPTPTQNLNSGQMGKGSTATSAPTAPTYSSEPTPATTLAQPASGPSLGDILRTVALVLLIGGVVLMLLSLVVARVA